MGVSCSGHHAWAIKRLSVYQAPIFCLCRRRGSDEIAASLSLLISHQRQNSTIASPCLHLKLVASLLFSKMREETREHQTLDTFALLPPRLSKDRLRLRGGNYYSSPGLPTVVIEKDDSKSHKSYWMCFKGWFKRILWIVGGLLLMDVANDYFFVGNGIPAPPIIQRDYSQINSIEDLVSGSDNNSAQPKCFVCLIGVCVF